MTNNTGFTKIPPIGHKFSDKRGKNGAKRNLKVTSDDREVRGIVTVEDLETYERFPYAVEHIPGYGKINLNFGVSSSKNEEVKSPPLWGFSGSKLYLSRYGLIKEENLPLFEVIGNTLNKQQPLGRPFIRGYKYHTRPIRNGFIYIYEKLSLGEDKSKLSEYKISEGRLSENLWTQKAVKEKLDIRESKKITDLDDFHLIDDEADEVWVAFSDIQWSYKYASDTFKNKDFREERFTNITLNSWYSAYEYDKENKHTEASSSYCLAGALPYYGVQWLVEQGSDHLSRIKNYWEQDSKISRNNSFIEGKDKRNLTLYFDVDDPVGCAFDIIEDLDHLYNQLNARVISISSSKSYETVLNALENGETINIDYTDKTQMQYNAMFMTAVMIFNLLYEQSGKELEDCRKKIQLDKILKLLAADERQKIKDQILGNSSILNFTPSVRNALGDMLSSNYYQNIINDYIFNTDDNAADGESIIALHHYKLKMRPQYIDNLLNVTREKARFMERQDSDLDIKALTTKDFEDKWDEYLYNSFYAKVGDQLHEPLYGSKNSRTINLTAHLYKKKILTPEKTLLEKNYKLAIKCILNTNTAFSMYSSYLGSYTRAVADDYMLWLDKYKQLMDDVYIREANSISDVVEEFDNWEKGFAPYSKGNLPPKKGFFNRVHRIFKAGKELYNENIRSGVRTSKEATKQKEISLAEKKSQTEITKLEQNKAERSEKVFARNTKRANNWAHKVFQSGAFRKMIIGLNIYNSTVATKSLANNVNYRNLFNLVGSYTSLASITLRYLQENTELMAKVAEEAVLADPIAKYASKGSTFVQRAWRQPVYTKLGWAGSAFMIVVSSMDTYDRFSKNDNDAAAAYAIATIAGIGSLGVSVYLATASAAIGWVPYVGWACLAVGFVATGIAVWLTDTALEAYLVNSVFGTHKEIDDIADWTPDNVKYELYTQRAAYANADGIEIVDMEDMEDMFAWLHDMLTNFRFDICKDSKPSLNDKNVKLGHDDLKYCYGFNVGFEFNNVLPDKSKLHYHLQIYPYGMDDENSMFETIEYKMPEIDNNGEQEENIPDSYSYNKPVSPIQVYKTLFVYDERKGCYTGDISFSFSNKLFELDDKGRKKEPLFSKEMIAVFYCRLTIDEENSLYWPYQGDDDNVYAASFALLTCKKSQSGSTRFNQELIRSNARIGTLAMILDEAKKFQDSHV